MKVYVGRGRGLGVDYDPDLTRAGQLSDAETAAMVRQVTGLTRAGELSDAETAELMRQVAAAPASSGPFAFLDSMDSQTKWLAGAGLGVLLWAVFFRKS